jgi:hypothetical protein
MENIHKDYEAIKEMALYYARDTGINYTVILLNPNEAGAFDGIASTYELVQDSYLESYKQQRNVKVLFRTDDVLHPVKKVLTIGLGPVGKYAQTIHLPTAATIHSPTSDHTPFKRTMPKVGNNDPCLCGSGKKYKHCCKN